MVWLFLMAVNVFAQAPSITYTNPQAYTAGVVITPLTVNNQGGPVPANNYGTVKAFAGSGNYGKIDATGTQASFTNPRGLAIDATGNILVADYGNNLIRKITPAAVVTTVTGFGYTDAAGNTVSLTGPSGLTLDAAGNIYVAVESDNLIKKITPSNYVTTLAGNYDIGNSNGTGAAAFFHQPEDVATDGSGNVFVADIGNSAVRKITAAGLVTTLAGGTTGYIDGIGTAAKFSGPSGVVTDAVGNIYAADIFNHVIRKITPAGKVTTFAGTGVQGESDGPIATATLNYPYKIAIDIVGNLYVSETNGGSRVRKISPDGIVSTVMHRTSAVDASGKGIDAGEIDATGLVVNNAGFLFVVNSIDNTIYKIAITGYSIDKPLPGGLSFNTATGTISGTPTAPSPLDEYTVTAYNLTGTSTFKVKIEVKLNDLPPPVLAPPVISYTTPNKYKINKGIIPLAPTNAGGPVPATLYGETSVLAGNGTIGTTDGDVANAKFISPYGISIDDEGNIYIAESAGTRLRKITPGGMVSTLAQDALPGPPFNVPKLNTPQGMVKDADGNLFIANTGNHTILKVTPDGSITVFAGGAPGGGYKDGQGTAAVIIRPNCIAIDADGTLYVADNTNRIRKITKSINFLTGYVSTLAGNGIAATIDGKYLGASFNKPNGIAVDDQGNLYVTEQAGNVIRKITPFGDVTTIAGSGQFGFADGTGSGATFGGPVGITIDKSGNLYVTQYLNGLIRRISPDHVVTTIAGGGPTGANSGLGTAAYFYGPTGVAIGPDGNLYVTDNNNFIKKVIATGYTIDKPLPPGLVFDPRTGIITGTPTVLWPATEYTITAYNKDGSSITTANIQVVDEIPPPVLPDPPIITYNTPNVYTVHTTIPPLAPINTGGAVPVNAYSEVSTLAGTGFIGNANGPGVGAAFHAPNNLVTDADGNIYVADSQNNQIRKITPDGVVSIFAGGGAQGNADGTGIGATFNIPLYITIADGYLYVSDALNSSIRRISPAGNVVTVATGINLPGGLAVDADGNIFVAENATSTILKISPAGTKTLYAGIPGNRGAFNGTRLASTFNHPTGLAIGTNGNLYVADASNAIIREINTVTDMVSTFAGGFIAPNGLAFDALGNLYVADPGTNKITKITPDKYITPLAGGTLGSSNGIGAEARFNYPTGVAVDLDGHLYVADYGNNTIRKVNITGYIIDKPLPAGLVFDPTTGIISGTPAVASLATDYTVTAYNTGGSSQFTLNIKVLAAAAINAGLVSGIISTCEGTATTDHQQFTVTGTDLLADITVTAPVGFEVSATENGNYSGAITLPQTDGRVDNVIVYVRMTASAAGVHSDNIVLSSLTVVDVNVPVQGIVNALPLVNHIDPQFLCNGSASAVVSITGTGDSYTWINSNPSIGLAASGSGDIASFIAQNNNDIPITATITVTPNSQVTGCNGIPITFTITVNPSTLPTVVFTSSTVTIKKGEQITLQPHITGNVTGYSWSPVTGLSDAAAAAPLASPSVTTTYTLNVTATSACMVPLTASAVITVNVVDDITIPNTFTPNGDGYNDTWVIPQLANYPGCVVSVFNRNGTQLFQSIGYTKAWNGTYNNSILPYGTYYYVIYPKNGFAKLSGYVTIIK